MNKSFIFCYLFLLTHFTGVSQVVYKKENLKFTNGLPSDIVLCTTKKDGKLYVATQRGLCQYDGYRFIKSPKTFGLTNSLFAKKKITFTFIQAALAYVVSELFLIIHKSYPESITMIVFLITIIMITYMLIDLNVFGAVTKTVLNILKIPKNALLKQVIIIKKLLKIFLF
jgi:hypothetical protein